MGGLHNPKVNQANTCMTTKCIISPVETYKLTFTFLQQNLQTPGAIVQVGRGDTQPPKAATRLCDLEPD